MRYVYMLYVATVMALNSFGTRQQDTEFADGPILKCRVVEVAGIPGVCSMKVKAL
jgi:hypothetical protein